MSKPILVQRVGSKWEIFVDVSSALAYGAKTPRIKKLAKKTSGMVAVSRGADGMLDLVPDGKPAHFTRDEADGLAHKIGNYMLGLGDMVYAYTKYEGETARDKNHPRRTPKKSRARQALSRKRKAKKEGPMAERPRKKRRKASLFGTKKRRKTTRKRTTTGARKKKRRTTPLKSVAYGRKRTKRRAFSAMPRKRAKKRAKKRASHMGRDRGWKGHKSEHAFASRKGWKLHAKPSWKPKRVAKGVRKYGKKGRDDAERDRGWKGDKKRHAEASARGWFLTGKKGWHPKRKSYTGSLASTAHKRKKRTKRDDVDFDMERDMRSHRRTHRRRAR
jgi:hypothetical protein